MYYSRQIHYLPSLISSMKARPAFFWMEFCHSWNDRIRAVTFRSSPFVFYFISGAAHGSWKDTNKHTKQLHPRRQYFIWVTHVRETNVKYSQFSTKNQRQWSGKKHFLKQLCKVHQKLKCQSKSIKIPFWRFINAWVSHTHTHTRITFHYPNCIFQV